MNEPHQDAGANLFGRVRTTPVHDEGTPSNEPQSTALTKDEPGVHPSEHKAEGAVGFETIWLTVDEAVAYCEEQGLSRTAKTIRKWAERSFNIPEGEVVSRREDTLWGRYRWKIEQASLARKVADELSREPVQTGANVSDDGAPEISDVATSNPSEPVQTGATKSQPRSTFSKGSHPSEPPTDVQTGSTESSVTDEVATLRAENRELRKQQDRERSEIEFLREEVTFNRSLKGDFANNSSRLLETLETLAIGGRLERGGGKREEPVRYQQGEVERGEV